MGVLSIVLAANSDTKLSTLTQVCSAYSWLNVGGKLLKLVALKRLFAEEKNIKRKLQKPSGHWPCPARMIIYRESTFVTPFVAFVARSVQRRRTRRLCGRGGVSKLMESLRSRRLAPGLAAWQDTWSYRVTLCPFGLGAVERCDP
jgi:hypothetical protein